MFFKVFLRGEEIAIAGSSVISNDFLLYWILKAALIK